MILLSWGLDILCTMTEAFCMYHYADIMFVRRIHTPPFFERYRWAFFGLPVSFYTLLVFLMNNVVLTSPYTVLCILIYSVFSIWIFWKCDFLNAVAVAGSYLWLLSASGTIEISITGLIGGEELIWLTTSEQGGIRVIYLCLLGTYWFTVNSMFAKWLEKRKLVLSDIKYLAKYLAMGSVVGIIGFFFIAEQMLASFCLNITLLDYCFLFAVSAYCSLFYYKSKNDHLRESLKVLEEQRTMLEKNYQRVREIYTMNAGLYHDMEYHLKALYNMAKDEKEIQPYIESLLHFQPDMGIKSRTSIDVLDIVLSEMEEKAKNKGILLNMEIPVLPQDIGIEKRDICTLFANLLENALEAASKEIVLKIQYINKMMIIRVENDCSAKPVIKDGCMQTTKRDAQKHGWGIQNIEYVVNRYHGDIEYKLIQDKFCVDILISLNL